jgi:hypothetical protein
MILLAKALGTTRFGNGAEKARKITVTKPDAMAARKKDRLKVVHASLVQMARRATQEQNSYSGASTVKMMPVKDSPPCLVDGGGSHACAGSPQAPGLLTSPWWAFRYKNLKAPQ